MPDGVRRPAAAGEPVWRRALQRAAATLTPPSRCPYLGSRPGCLAAGICMSRRPGSTMPAFIGGPRAAGASVRRKTHFITIPLAIQIASCPSPHHDAAGARRSSMAGTIDLTSAPAALFGPAPRLLFRCTILRRP